jgi:8-oxo-dGTP pyrophosphatase MutT (NUDIX family)
MMEITPETLPATTIRTKLKAAPHAPIHNPYPEGFLRGEPKPAAVLIPFLELDNAWHLLFIRRTNQKNDRHSGQVAFPGGRWDAEDQDAVDAAKREAHEEVGVHPGEIEVLGNLHDFLSVTNYLVTPVVSQIPWPYPLQLQTSEVSRAFTLPLGWLAEPGNYRIEYRHLLGFDPFPVIYFNTYDGEVLWGFTARVTLHLLETLDLIPPIVGL